MDNKDSKKDSSKIVKSLSFEVITTQEPDYGSNDANVKIRLKRKDKPINNNAIISIRKRGGVTGHQPAENEKIHLAASDQTIMSFNIIVESDTEDGSEKKKETEQLKSKPYKRSILSLLRSGKDDDFKTKQRIRNTRKYGRTTFFGKCKPGGCLDPSVDEESNPYELARSIKPGSAQNNKTLDENNRNVSDANENKEKGSILHIFQGEPLQNYDTSKSNSMINYPPAVTNSQLKDYKESSKESSEISSMSKKPDIRNHVKDSFDDDDVQFFRPKRDSESKRKSSVPMYSRDEFLSNIDPKYVGTNIEDSAITDSLSEKDTNINHLNSHEPELTQTEQCKEIPVHDVIPVNVPQVNSSIKPIVNIEAQCPNDMALNEKHTPIILKAIESVTPKLVSVDKDVLKSYESKPTDIELKPTYSSDKTKLIFNNNDSENISNAVTQMSKDSPELNQHSTDLISINIILSGSQQPVEKHLKPDPCSINLKISEDAILKDDRAQKDRERIYIVQQGNSSDNINVNLNLISHDSTKFDKEATVKPEIVNSKNNMDEFDNVCQTKEQISLNEVDLVPKHINNNQKTLDDYRNSKMDSKLESDDNDKLGHHIADSKFEDSNTMNSKEVEPDDKMITKIREGKPPNDLNNYESENITEKNHLNLAIANNIQGNKHDVPIEPEKDDYIKEESHKYVKPTSLMTKSSDEKKTDSAFSKSSDLMISAIKDKKEDVYVPPIELVINKNDIEKSFKDTMYDSMPDQVSRSIEEGKKPINDKSTSPDKGKAIMEDAINKGANVKTTETRTGENSYEQVDNERGNTLIPATPALKICSEDIKTTSNEIKRPDEIIINKKSNSAQQDTVEINIRAELPQETKADKNNIMKTNRDKPQPRRESLRKMSKNEVSLNEKQSSITYFRASVNTIRNSFSGLQKSVSKSSRTTLENTIAIDDPKSVDGNLRLSIQSKLISEKEELASLTNMVHDKTKEQSKLPQEIEKSDVKNTQRKKPRIQKALTSVPHSILQSPVNETNAYDATLMDMSHDDENIQLKITAKSSQKELPVSKKQSITDPVDSSTDKIKDDLMKTISETSNITISNSITVNKPKIFKDNVTMQKQDNSSNSIEDFVQSPITEPHTVAARKIDKSPYNEIKHKISMTKTSKTELVISKAQSVVDPVDSSTDKTRSSFTDAMKTVSVTSRITVNYSTSINGPKTFEDVVTLQEIDNKINDEDFGKINNKENSNVTVIPDDIIPGQTVIHKAMSSIEKTLEPNVGEDTTSLSQLTPRSLRSDVPDKLNTVITANKSHDNEQQKGEIISNMTPNELPDKKNLSTIDNDYSSIRSLSPLTDISKAKSISSRNTTLEPVAVNETKNIPVYAPTYSNSITRHSIKQDNTKPSESDVEIKFPSINPHTGMQNTDKLTTKQDNEYNYENDTRTEILHFEQNEIINPVSEQILKHHNASTTDISHIEEHSMKESISKISNDGLPVSEKQSLLDHSRSSVNKIRSPITDLKKRTSITSRTSITNSITPNERKYVEEDVALRKRSNSITAHQESDAMINDREESNKMDKISIETANTIIHAHDTTIPTQMTEHLDKNIKENNKLEFDIITNAMLEPHLEPQPNHVSESPTGLSYDHPRRESIRKTSRKESQISSEKKSLVDHIRTSINKLRDSFTDIRKSLSKSSRSTINDSITTNEHRTFKDYDQLRNAAPNLIEETKGTSHAEFSVIYETSKPVKENNGLIDDIPLINDKDAVTEELDTLRDLVTNQDRLAPQPKEIPLNLQDTTIRSKSSRVSFKYKPITIQSKMSIGDPNLPKHKHLDNTQTLINVAFTTFINKENQTVIKSLDAENTQEYTKGKVTHKKAAMEPPEIEMCFEMDFDNILCLRVLKNAMESQTKEFRFGDTSKESVDDSQMQLDTASCALYEDHLNSLLGVMKSIRHDVELLSAEQKTLKQNYNVSNIKSQPHRELKKEFNCRGLNLTALPRSLMRLKQQIHTLVRRQPRLRNVANFLLLNVIFLVNTMLHQRCKYGARAELHKTRLSMSVPWEPNLIMEKVKMIKPSRNGGSLV